MLKKKSFREMKTRFPEPVQWRGETINVNFCKNINCDNYGVPADVEHIKRGPKPAGFIPGGDYYYPSYSDQEALVLKCMRPNCGEMPPVKNNQGVAEELERIIAYLMPDKAKASPDPVCPNPACENHLKGIPVSAGKKFYYKHTPTSARTPRVRCRGKIGGKTICGKTITLVHENDNPIYGQHRSCVNKIVFGQIFTGATIKSGCKELKKISKASLYDKVDFFREQCLAFAADRERCLLGDKPPIAPDPFDGKMKPIDRVYVSLDRHFYTVNWKRPERRRKRGAPRRPLSPLSPRAIRLTGLASCDEERKYIFGITVNYDSSLSQEDFADCMNTSGKGDWLQCFRPYARYWTNDEHWAAVDRNEKAKQLEELTLKNSKGEVLTIEEQSELRYLASEKNPNIEAADHTHENDTQLPIRGMQVHDDYTMYGHFLFLRKILGWAGKVRFFFEQESAMRAACLTAFADRIKEQRCDAFYLMFRKRLDFGDNSAVVAEAKDEIRKTMRRLKCKRKAAREHLLLEAVRNAKPRKRGKYGTKDKFAKMPFSDFGEPHREVAYLTDRGKFSPEGVKDETHLAWLYNEATMHNLSSFFNQIRAKISPLSRPEGTGQTIALDPATANRKKGKISKYRPHYTYKPEMVQKWLDIFRVYHNFVLVSEKDKMTPAMRMGLAKKPIPIEKILYYRKSA